MIQLVILVIGAIILYEWFVTKEPSKKKARKQRMNAAKKSENNIKEINQMIEDTKAEISNCARKENTGELKEYVEMLEMLLEERANITSNKKSATTKNVAKKVGKTVKDIKSGIQEGFREK